MITDLRLQRFRSYSDSSFELSSGVNIVVGPNASGKTNLLEALLVLAHGSSYRAIDIELIQFDEPWARLDGHTKNTGIRTVKLFRDETPNKIYELEGKTYKRLPLTQSLPVVLFEPNHLLLLSGGPERRRDYLDDLLEQTTVGYSAIRRQYKRALAQRNSLLKQGNANQTKIFPWDIKLSQLAGQIVRMRCNLAEQINQDITKLYKKLSGTKTKVRVDYQHRWNPDQYETRLLSELESTLHSDKQRGFTSSGPHREDLVVYFDDHPAQETASRGEARTTILALKIIELKIVETAREITPLLLLDDVFSELDGKRRHALTDYLAPYQTFITTTDADLAIKNFTQNCHIIPLS